MIKAYPVLISSAKSLRYYMTYFGLQVDFKALMIQYFSYGMNRIMTIAVLNRIHKNKESINDQGYEILRLILEGNNRGKRKIRR